VTLVYDLAHDDSKLTFCSYSAKSQIRSRMYGLRNVRARVMWVSIVYSRQINECNRIR